MRRNRTPAAVVAFGGVMAALALVIMCLGTVIPIATYAAPVLSIVVGQMVFKVCGSRIGWAWYAAVTMLSLLLAPDKEAAAVYAALGYYPMLKPWLDRRKGKWLLKLLLFNGSIVLLYWLLLKLIGMEQLLSDFSGMGSAMYVILLILGNVTFFLLDYALGRKLPRRK